MNIGHSYAHWKQFYLIFIGNAECEMSSCLLATIIDIEFVYWFTDGGHFNFFVRRVSFAFASQCEILSDTLSENYARRAIPNGRKSSVTFICPHYSVFILPTWESTSKFVLWASLIIIFGRLHEKRKKNSQAFRQHAELLVIAHKSQVLPLFQEKKTDHTCD